MSTACVAVRDLARIDSLPESAPERVHVAQCPRCRSLMLAYHEFAQPGALPEGARMAEAEAALAAMLEREVRGVRVDTRAAVVPAGRGGAGWWSRLVGPTPVRAAFALAALVVAAGAVWFAAQPRLQGPPVMRGDSTGTILALRVEGAQVRSRDGAIELRWEAIRGADHYLVSFYGSDLGDLPSPPPVTDTRLVLERASLPAGLVPGSDVLWQVSAFRQGERLAQSPLISARLP